MLGAALLPVLIIGLWGVRCSDLPSQHQGLGPPGFLRLSQVRPEVPEPCLGPASYLAPVLRSVCQERGLWNCSAQHCGPQRTFCPGDLVYVPGACLLTCDSPGTNHSCPPDSMGSCVCPPGTVLLVSPGGGCMGHRGACCTPGHCPNPAGCLKHWVAGQAALQGALCPRPLPSTSAACLLSSAPAVMAGSGIRPTLPSRRTATFGMPSPLNWDELGYPDWSGQGKLSRIPPMLRVGCSEPGQLLPQDSSSRLCLPTPPPPTACVRLGSGTAQATGVVGGARHRAPPTT